MCTDEEGGEDGGMENAAPLHQDHPSSIPTYDVEKPESGVQHTTLEPAGAPTPIRVLDALGPPEIHCNCTKSIDLPFLHDTIQKGDPQSQLYAFQVGAHMPTTKYGMLERKVGKNPTMGRPPWPENVARRYSQLGSPRRHICRHAPRHTGTDLSQHCTIHRDSRSWKPREPFSPLCFFPPQSIT